MKTYCELNSGRPLNDALSPQAPLTVGLPGQSPKAHSAQRRKRAFIVACLLALLGLLMFGSVILNAGPLG